MAETAVSPWRGVHERYRDGSAPATSRPDSTAGTELGPTGCVFCGVSGHPDRMGGEDADNTERNRSPRPRSVSTADDLPRSSVRQGRQVGGTKLPTLRRLTEIARLIERTDSTVYLRYSHGPDRDREAGGSRDYEADHDMPGLSVSTIEPEDWWTRTPVEWIARRIRQYADLGAEQDRYAWLLTGQVAGAGPDHEPLLTGIKPLARLSPDVIAEAARLYHERFHVGRDSTQETHS